MFGCTACLLALTSSTILFRAFGKIQNCVNCLTGNGLRKNLLSITVVIGTCLSMDGNTPQVPSPPIPQERSAWRRVAAAIAVSTLLHVFIAVIMRPAPRPVSDFAVSFEIAHIAPAPPSKQPEPEPEIEPQSEPEPIIEEPKPKKRAPKIKTEEAPILALNEEPLKDNTPSVSEGIDTDTSSEAGGGICMHDLFAFTQGEPTWVLYVASAAFRQSIYEKELSNTFNSFELGRRLASLTGMELTRDVESLLVAAQDIFEWRTFQIAAVYDFGEENLAARIKDRQKSNDLSWSKTDNGLEASIPGQFKWELTAQGRVMSVVHEPEKKNKLAELPENPFAEDSDTSPREVGTDIGTTQESDSPQNTANTASSKHPKQVECLSALPSQSEKDSKTKVARKKRESALILEAKSLIAPDAKGHWPVAVLTSADPRAVGLGVRMGNRMGFEIAAVRGYFTDPVRLEGYIRFGKDPAAVEALAASWKKEAERFAADPFLAVAGIASLLKSLNVYAKDNTVQFSIEMKPNQVLSTLMFLQLQGKALERQLMSD